MINILAIKNSGRYLTANKNDFYMNIMKIMRVVEKPCSF